MWDIRMQDLSDGLFVGLEGAFLCSTTDSKQYINIGSIIYGIVIMLLKTCILLEWARIFVPRGWRNAFWWTCHTLIGVNVLFYVILTFIEVFGCNPREKHWNPTLPGKCLDMMKVHPASAIVNFFSDLVILFLPQKLIWGLKLCLKKKAGVTSIFAMGVL